MIWLYISLGILALFIILIFILLIFLHHSTFYSPLKGQNDDFTLTKATYELGINEEIFQMIKALKDEKYIPAHVTSFDKLDLFARVYENKKSNKVVILFHGYRGTAIRDFSGFAKLMIDQGHNVILVDERGHGLSQGHNITFGNREKYDVLSWINYAKKYFGNDKELILAGISMGGASLLFASNLIKEPVKIICDSPYTKTKEVINESIKRMKLSPKFFYPFVNLSSIIFSHASLNKDDAFKSIKNAPHRYLIIHGENDSIVPIKYTEKLYLENKDKIQFEIFPNTEHGLGFVTDKKRYIKLVTDFINS